MAEFMAWPPQPLEPQPPPIPQVICQSCSMPMVKEEDFGTDAKGKKNTDYCSHCLKQGKFTMPDITMKEMIEHISLVAQKYGIDSDTAREHASRVLPTLKRWRNALAGKKSSKKSKK